MNIRKAAGLTAVLLVFCFSCASGSNAYRKIDAGVSSGAFSNALSLMEEEEFLRYVYPPRNEILYRLDRGMIEHYAGLWTDSSQNLQEAERLIEAAFTKSISQEIGSYIVNDNVKEYPGEDYEDIYTNVFNSLNYYNCGDLEGAMVEIRRVNEKLRYLSDKYEIASKKITDSNSDLSGKDYAVEAVRFSSSALARYLSLLFFRGTGNNDNARIDLEELYRAYELAPAVYLNKPPSFLKDELDIPAGKARLNIIAFTGLSPVKEEVNVSLPLPLPYPNNWARLALPQMADRPSGISTVEIVLNNGRRFTAELIEDISRVVRETFRARYGLTVLKTTARTIGKSTASAGIAQALRKQDENLGDLFGILGRIASDLSEGADLRVSRYFPGRAYIGGVDLDPGVYSVTVNFYGPRSLIATMRQDNVRVLSDKLNLTEFVCLK